MRAVHTVRFRHPRQPARAPSKYAQHQQAGLPPPQAHQPGPRSILAHPYPYPRPATSVRGLSSPKHLQEGVQGGHGCGCHSKHSKMQVGQQAGLPPHDAHQPGPRSIHSHLCRYPRPVVPAGGLSAASRLQCGVGKGNMTNFGCMGLWWYRPAWVGQTAVGGAKGGPGPPPGVTGQLRWAVVRVCEGGGAQHPCFGAWAGVGGPAWWWDGWWE